MNIDLLLLGNHQKSFYMVLEKKDKEVGSAVNHDAVSQNLKGARET